MNESSLMETNEAAWAIELHRIQAHINRLLKGRIGDARVLARGGGLVLQGQAATYYVKQLAQQAVMIVALSVLPAALIEVVKFLRTRISGH